MKANQMRGFSPNREITAFYPVPYRFSHLGEKMQSIVAFTDAGAETIFTFKPSTHPGNVSKESNNIPKE